MIELHLRWLRRFFDIDVARLRVQLYLHEGLDLDEAVSFWSNLTDIPLTRFTRPYRAVGRRRDPAQQAPLRVPVGGLLLLPDAPVRHGAGARAANLTQPAVRGSSIGRAFDC